MKHIPRRFRTHYYRDRAEGKRLALSVASIYKRHQELALEMFGGSR